MKKAIFIFLLCPIGAVAETLSVTCPAGHIMVSDDATIAETCPAGTINVGTVKSCLSEDASGGCYMYTSVGMSFSDDTGTLEYTDVCMME